MTAKAGLLSICMLMAAVAAAELRGGGLAGRAALMPHRAAVVETGMMKQADVDAPPVEAYVAMRELQASATPSRTPSPTPSLTSGLASHVFLASATTGNLTLSVLALGFTWVSSTNAPVRFVARCDSCVAGDNFGVAIGANVAVLQGGGFPQYVDAEGALPADGARAVIINAASGVTYFIRIYATSLPTATTRMSLQILLLQTNSASPTARSSASSTQAPNSAAAIAGGAIGGAVLLVAIGIVAVVLIRAMRKRHGAAAAQVRSTPQDGDDPGQPTDERSGSLYVPPSGGPPPSMEYHAMNPQPFVRSGSARIAPLDMLSYPVVPVAAVSLQPTPRPAVNPVPLPAQHSVEDPVGALELHPIETSHVMKTADLQYHASQPSVAQLQALPPSAPPTLVVPSDAQPMNEAAARHPNASVVVPLLIAPLGPMYEQVTQFSVPAVPELPVWGADAAVPQLPEWPLSNDDPSTYQQT